MMTTSEHLWCNTFVLILYEEGVRRNLRLHQRIGLPFRHFRIRRQRECLNHRPLFSDSVPIFVFLLWLESCQHIRTSERAMF